MPDVEFKENRGLVEELCSDLYNNEVLHFFARHPYTRFDRQVLTRGLGLSDSRRIELALEGLVSRKLVETRSSGGTLLYWLTRREPTHSAVKSVLAPKAHKPGEALDRLSMMQLIMPLTPCPVLAVSGE